MADFVNRLRMNSIYPENGINPFGPISGHEFDLQGAINAIYPLIAQEKDKDRQLQRDLAMPRTRGALQQIGSAAANMPTPAPSIYHVGQATPSTDAHAIQTHYAPLITPYQQGTLDLRRQELGLKSELGKGKLEQGERGLDIRENLGERRADTSQYSAETRRQLANLHNMTDSEKLKMLQEGKVTLENLKDAAALNRVQESNKGREKVQEMRGAQGLEQIGRRIEGQKEIKESTQRIGELPTQERVRQFNNARKLVNERPDLAKYIKIGEGNNFTIGEVPDDMTRKMINDVIFGSSGKDIKLPSDKSKPTVKSKNNDPLGIR